MILAGTSRRKFMNRFFMRSGRQSSIIIFGAGVFFGRTVLYVMKTKSAIAGNIYEICNQLITFCNF
jgi:hypothetical protein